MKQSKAIKVPMPALVLASVAVLVSNAELLVSGAAMLPAPAAVLVSGAAMLPASAVVLIASVACPSVQAAPAQNKPLMRHDVRLKLSGRPDKIESLASKQAAAGNLTQSMATLDNAIKNNSAQSAYYLFEKAQLHYALEETETAEKEFVAAWKSGKLSPDALMHAAWTMHHLGLTKPVLDITSQIIATKTAPEVAAAYFTRARTYVLMGEDAKALLDYEASCKLNADDAPALFELGRLYFYNGRYKKAIETLTQALTKFKDRKEQQNCINTLTIRAKANNKFNRAADSIKDYSEAIALSPLQRDLLIERAAVYKSMGEKAKAAADEQKAKALDKGLDF
ncbi:MAG: tetratricopeptide repeat protein [Candidatus Obscuribacter sp.]|nr:tetratricopeptide repeat protein [Candidatus Obscuribacter sp.]